MQRAKQELDEAVESKDFAKAWKLNEEIDMLEKKVESEKSQVGEALEVIGGKKQNYVISVDGGGGTFESRFELEQETAATKRVQSDAIASKEFKKAEACQLVIDEMEALCELPPTVAELEKNLWEKKWDMNKAISEKRFADAEQFDQSVDILEN